MPLRPGVDALDVEVRASWISSDEIGGQSRVARGGGSSGWEGRTVAGVGGKKRLARECEMSSWEQTGLVVGEGRKGGMRDIRRPCLHRVAAHSLCLAV